LQLWHPDLPLTQQMRAKISLLFYLTRSMEAISLATLLLNTVRIKKATYKELGKLFVQHLDHDIFASLPGVGKLLAPALLVKFGDDRDRFPVPASVQILAGTCPVTSNSRFVAAISQSRRVLYAVVSGPEP